MSEIDKVYELLKQLQSTFGIGVVFVIIFLVTTLYLYWKLILKKIELIAQKNFEGILTEIRIKTHKKYEKQIDVMHECYSRIQKINSYIKYLNGEYQLYEEVLSHEIIPKFKQLRNEFYDEYSKHKIIFSLDTCEKIEHVISALDNYIKKYETGLDKAKHIVDATWDDGKEKKKVRVTGVWLSEDLDKVRLNLEAVITKIEEEFRALYEAK